MTKNWEWISFIKGALQKFLFLIEWRSIYSFFFCLCPIFSPGQVRKILNTVAVTRTAIEETIPSGAPILASTVKEGIFHQRAIFCHFLMFSSARKDGLTQFHLIKNIKGGFVIKEQFWATGERIQWSLNALNTHCSWVTQVSLIGVLCYSLSNQHAPGWYRVSWRARGVVYFLIHV